MSEIESGFGGFLKMLFADEKYNVEPFDPNDFIYIYQAKGKLIEVKNKKHKSLINIKTSGIPFVIEASFSKINGIVEIVK